MIEFKNGVYFSRIFYLELLFKGRRGNMMGALYKLPGADAWTFKYRTRWYVDEDLTSNSKDERNWYEAETKPEITHESAVEMVREIFASAATASGNSKVEEVVIESDRALVMQEKLMAAPWAHPGVTAPHQAAGQA